ncbi:hypothetical protein J6590_011416 [Homalodisca vitripennis]|nr:hypothetical protein J6590_011416 [Homalodisca vitripennis]
MEARLDTVVAAILLRFTKRSVVSLYGRLIKSVVYITCGFRCCSFTTDYGPAPDRKQGSGFIHSFVIVIRADVWAIKLESDTDTFGAARHKEAAFNECNGAACERKRKEVFREWKQSVSAQVSAADLRLSLLADFWVAFVTLTHR